MRQRRWFSYRSLYPRRRRVMPGDLRVCRGCGAPQVPPREIIVSIPREAANSGRRFPVLYMQDGRSMFDPDTSLAGSWRVGETMEALRAERDEEIHGRPGGGDRYLDFVVDVVKPLIDDSFPTLPGPERTGIIGSSLGGLISLYAFFSRPGVFGFAGAMSPAVPASQNALFELIGRGRSPRGRLYLDVGGREGDILSDPAAATALSAGFLDCLDRLHGLLVTVGYRDGHDLLVTTDEQATHEEPAWAARLPDALRFLLPR